MAFGSGGARVAESAKARIRRASLLRNEDFRLLLEQTSVGDIAVQLGKSAYAPMLKGHVLESMRRSELEFLLNVSILAEGVAFGHYTGLGDKRLLNLWLENFDVELLKNHFQTHMKTSEWGDHLDPGKMLDLVSDFRLTLVDQEKLSSSDTLKDILMSVRSESLRSAMMEAVPGGERALASWEGDLQRITFALGMILDRYYFDNLYAAVARLGGDEGRMMRMLVGTRVDLMNLYWIYRARRFFDKSPEEALTLIMKARYRLDFGLLTRAAFADPRAMAAALEGTPYARVFDARVENSEDGSGALKSEALKGEALYEVGVERNIYRFLFAVAERVFLSGALGFQNVAAYLVLKELEVRDLVAVVEMVRYGFDKNRIDLILVRTLGKEN
ncbi:MAG: V-type ATPase subunit [Synergistaceae bacterium]|jgi:V/A-type H+-transporting ATPase subunit C|nr:V-type ATPase subunit [Synergistaceae bacterium]